MGCRCGDIRFVFQILEMIMTLHTEWKKILRKAHSVKAAALGIVIAGGQEFVSGLQGVVPNWAYIVLFGAVIAFRVTRQKNYGDE